MLQDKEILSLIKKEEKRQKTQLQMIPSENFVSEQVKKAVGSALMNKYSEGQAYKRYYQGNTNIDAIETIVKKRALKAFKLSPKKWGVNVQAVTGSVANLAVYNAILRPGDKILSMYLFDGGHLSHGWQLPSGKKVSMTSKIYEPNYYYVDPKTGIFNYDEVEKRALEVKPKLIISGGTAYPREIDYKRLSEIAKKVGAKYMADIAHEAGLVLAGVNKSPFDYADIVTMTTRKTLRGPVGAMIFSKIEYSEEIDKSVFPGLQGGPQNHSIAGIGVALYEAMTPEFKVYAKQVVKNAQILAGELEKLGFFVLTGGTDKHLIVMDLLKNGIKESGTEIALALEKANIIVNKNTVPGDQRKPWDPSGIRFGTPAITTMGMKEKEMKEIAGFYSEVLRNPNNEKALSVIARKVVKLTSKFSKK